MSRIGNKPITIPEEVQVLLDNDTLKVKGPKGELEQVVNLSLLSIVIEDGKLSFKRKSEQKEYVSMHGLYRSLANNMIIGVTEGYKKELELVGVGYRVSVEPNNFLLFNLGYSHSIYLQLPKSVLATCRTEKNKNSILAMECIDKQLLGTICAKIKKLRKIDPYKGKGIRFVGENIRRKVGKSSGK